MSNGLLSGYFPTQSRALDFIETGTQDAAPVSTVAGASIIQDPAAKMRYYSSQMGIPLERFGVKDGRIVYRTDRGTLQAVDPGLIRSFVKGTGGSFPAVGGAVGTVLGAPFGPPGMLTLGTGGAMTGQFLREATAKGMAGQKISPLRVGIEGAIDLGASLTGLFIGKGLTRAAARDAAAMFNSAIKETGATAATALRKTVDAVNKTYGTKIKITPAELTGDAGLIAMQKALAGDPRTAETMAEFAAERGGQFGSAVSQALEGIAPGAPAREVAGAQLSEAAEQSMVNMAKARAAAGGPAYTKAFEAGAEVDVSGFVKVLQDALAKNPRLGPKLRSTLKFIADPVKNDAGQVVGYRPKSGISLEFVQDNVKEVIDDYIRVGGKQGMKFREIQGALLQAMDQQVPEYAAARKMWGDLSRPIDDIEGGLIPMLANKNIRDFEYLGGRFLKNSSPSAIAQARDNIFKVDGGEQIWNGFIRGSLETTWEAATKLRQGEISRPDLGPSMAPARFWVEFGQGEGYKRLKAALSPDQMQAMDNLLEVMKAASRAVYTGTDTAAKESAKETLEKTGGAGALQFAVAPWAIPGALQKATGRQLANANVRKLADIITNEGSVEALKEISAGKGGGFFNEQNLIIVGRALAQGGGVVRPMVYDPVGGRVPAPLAEDGGEPQGAFPGGSSNPLNQ